MATDLFSAVLGDLIFADFEHLIQTSAEEGLRLEFKRGLATSDGRPDRWMRDQSSIGNVARDDIAKEVVAFANAYGGILIIGIDETEDNPKRASNLFEPQIPKVIDCAERVVQSLRSIIDPPIPMLEARGVESEAGDGVVIIRVPGSSSAPHGFGRPTNAYVRRGAASEPLTMRDMQSIFFERRTRFERLEKIRAAQSEQADETVSQWHLGKLQQPHSQGALDNTQGVLFQLSLEPVLN
jgi:hypothetical protein